ncbi:dTDP-4-dehydrorhamnose reductase [Flavobacterium suncheonense]|uniref:dTDP-4-dehydrorhamnose reductase n=1 Tax=Flavobacterium suncheonense GH29-5 = DSM 17707 TaxID=1121899 RepID=A0A0A2M9X2_9FLAO|nr:dTDP-4-dehydrorhamnose reductase [Flavobacterium suncheonense]KGO89064.1 dTDP-4-dehydrorhamnose reductase [Flavobacterium suncheonense GH29-5 = DSM 17707]
MVVLVTGAGGQLGQALRYLAPQHPEFSFVFCTSSELDITDKTQCERVFDRYQPEYCINTAAYTAVDKAEIEPEKAKAINVTGAQNLAEVCQRHHTVLLHLSTDFIFDGSKTAPYTETDVPHPSGVYGQTKLDGEKALQSIWEKHFIIRTSWVYSQFGHNFMKTMLRLASERDSLSVVNDQIGTPTHAVDLAAALLTIISSKKDAFGIYNFSNEGQCSWYDFAQEIFRINNVAFPVHPIPTAAYPTPAKRPAYSVLDKSKIKNTFGLVIKKWEEALQPFPS